MKCALLLLLLAPIAALAQTAPTKTAATANADGSVTLTYSGGSGQGCNIVSGATAALVTSNAKADIDQVPGNVCPLTGTYTFPGGTFPYGAAIFLGVDYWTCSSSCPLSALGPIASATPINPAPPVLVPASIAVTWTAPTQNTDGSTLTDLAAFHLYRASVPFTTTAQATLLTSLTAPTLAYTDTITTVGTFYYGVTALNKAGLESTPLVSTNAIQTATPPAATVPKSPSTITITCTQAANTVVTCTAN